MSASSTAEASTVSRSGLPPAIEGPADRLAVEADLLGLRAPALPKALLGQVAVLGLPRLKGGDLAGAGGGVGRGGGEDLRPPGREGAEMVGVEALDLGDAVGDLLPADAEPAGQLMAKVRLVDVAGGLRVVVDRRVVEPGPAAVRPAGRVGDEDVGVELRVAGAGGAVEVGGGDEAVAVDELAPAVAAPGPAGLALHVVECGGDRGAVGGGDLRPGALAAERPGQRDRLRRREGEVEAGDRATARDVA